MVHACEECTKQARAIHFHLEVMPQRDGLALAEYKAVFEGPSKGPVIGAYVDERRQTHRGRRTSLWLRQGV